MLKINPLLQGCFFFFFFGRSLVELEVIAFLQVLLGLTTAIELADKIHLIQVPLLVTI